MDSVLQNSLLIVLLIFITACSSEDKPADRISDRSFYFNTLDVEIKDKTSTKTATGIAIIKFNSKQDHNLRWRQIYNETPDDWSLYFCDNVACHFELPDSVDLKTINYSSPEKERTMKLFVTTNSSAGKGKVKLELFDLNDPSLKDTVAYNISIE